MTTTFFHVLLVGGNKKKKEIGKYGQLTSAHSVVDRLVSRLVNKHKRNLTEKPVVEHVENEEGVHTFVRLTVRAHKFRKIVHAHHFLVTEQEMGMSRGKPIKTYQDEDIDYVS